MIKKLFSYLNRSLYHLNLLKSILKALLLLLHKNQILMNIDKDEKNYFIDYLSKSDKFKNLQKDFPYLEEFLQSQQIINNEIFNL